MSKIIKNVTNNLVSISDTGVSISANGSYTLNQTEYDIWAASSDIVTLIGNDSLVVNDGSFDLNKSDGLDLIKGIFNKNVTLIDGGGAEVGTKTNPFFAETNFSIPASFDRVTIMGINNSLATVREDVWEVSSVYPLIQGNTGIGMKIKSTSANDTSNGTGVRSVRIHYLDSGYNAYEEVVVLNGTNWVSTVDTDIFRVNDIRSETVGSKGTAVGSISLCDNTTGTIIYSYIRANGNVARSCIYTVPLGKTLYIKSWTVGVGGSGGKYLEFTLRATTDLHQVRKDGIFQFKDCIISDSGVGGNTFTIPIKVCEKCDVKVSVVITAAAANAACSASFDGWLEDNV